MDSSIRRRVVALTLTVMLVLPLSVVAARWQWTRHLEREAMNVQIESVRTASVEPFPGALADGYQDRDRYRNVSAQGSFVFDEQQLVRKSVVNGAVGFNVMTPFLTHDGVILYVVRGWTAEAAVESIHASSVPMTVVLRIQAVQPNGDMKPKDLPPGEINWVDPDALARGRTHASVVFELVDPIDPALVAIPAPITSSGPHLSYALQWMLIGITAVIVYVRLMRSEIQESRENWVL